MPPPLPEQQLSAIKETIFRGEKIAAIKLYREAIPSGLAEAKDAVEKIEAGLRQTSPEKFTSPPAGKGCVGVLALSVAVIVVVAWFSRT
ncbi:MAG: hypothetical protein RL693_1837 [Verrucomicrobiota bacterium]|jgi:hypothetical protein